MYKLQRQKTKGSRCSAIRKTGQGIKQRNKDQQVNAALCRHQACKGATKDKRAKKARQQLYVNEDAGVNEEKVPFVSTKTFHDPLVLRGGGAITIRSMTPIIHPFHHV